MEFFPENAAATADTTACAGMFEGHTVLVPAVSCANLGQLTLDLIINTFLQNGQAFQVEMMRAGHLFSEDAPPIAGGAAFGMQAPDALCLNLEVYSSAEKKLSIIQQRTAVLPGRAHAFAHDLVDWAVGSKVAALCVVAGCDDMLRHDPNMLSRQVRTIYSADAVQQDDKLAARFAGLPTPTEPEPASPSANATPSDQWNGIRGAGLAPLLHTQCEAQTLPFIAFVMACAEGDNVPDAVAVASQLLASLRLLPEPTQPSGNSAMVKQMPMIPFAFPPSWSQLFGRGPDVSLYL